MWRVYRIDPITWNDDELVDGFLSAKIERRISSKLIESASIKFDSSVYDSFSDGYYRIARIDGVTRTNVATMLLRKGNSVKNHKRSRLDITGFSVLKPADTKKLVNGEFAQSGSDGVQEAAKLLRSCINAPITTSGSFILDSHIVYDIGSSVLDAVWLLLDAGAYIMQINGAGEVHIRPKDEEPIATINSSIVAPGITHEKNTLTIPNRYIAINGAAVSSVINDSASSSTSIQSIGYYIDEVDESPTLVNGESLLDYATRKLAEISIIKDVYTYKREYLDGVLPGSLIHASLLEAGIESTLTVDSQELTCSASMAIKEKSYSEVRTWPI